jgi:NTE family protein
VIVGVYVSPLKAVSQDDLDSALEIVQRALDVGIYFHAKARFHDCDLVIHPPGLTPYNLFDTRHLDEIYQLGYQAAQKHLDAIEEAIEAFEEG